MPWSNQSGGGGGSGGGGPWGNRGNSGGPWGGGPSGGGGGGGGGPPDLEQILRRSQDRLKDFIPGGGSVGGKGIAALALGAAMLWLATGFYTVGPREVGINTIFGRYTGQTSNGLNYNLPYPIGRVEKPNVEGLNTVSVGSPRPGVRAGTNDRLDERLMLTGDGNIVDITFDAQWRIDPARAQDYVFNLANPDGTVKSVAESAMREVVGRRNIQAILTTEQAAIQQEVQEIMQKTLDDYGAGIRVNVVQFTAVQPPQPVREAFLDVNAAQQNAVQVQNEAETYANREVPAARGRAAEIVQRAEGYREQQVAEATGQAARFSQVYDEYRKAPDVIRERIFLETMERVLGGMDKVIIDQAGGGGVVPYLPLPEVARRGTAAAGQNQAGAVR